MKSLRRAARLLLLGVVVLGALAAASELDHKAVDLHEHKDHKGDHDDKDDHKPDHHVPDQAEEKADKEEDLPPAPEHHNGHHGKDRDHHGGHHEVHHDRHVVEEKASDPHHHEQYDALDSRLNKITAKLQHIEDELEGRLDPRKIRRAMSLEHRVELLEESVCDKDHYYCGREDPECVSRLLVCDGVNDCRSGDDEKHCELPTKSGDTFVGHVVYDNCTQRRPEEISFTITGVKTNPAFTAFPKVRATIHISSDHDHDDHEGQVALPTFGYYRFATQNLILLPPEEDRLGLICDFDGHNPDKCVGDIVHELSLKPCAQFIFFRERDEEDDHH